MKANEARKRTKNAQKKATEESTAKLARKKKSVAEARLSGQKAGRKGGKVYKEMMKSISEATSNPSRGKFAGRGSSTWYESTMMAVDYKPEDVAWQDGAAESLMRALKKEGYEVKSKNGTAYHTPFGSDPGFYDPYNSRWIKVTASW